MADEAIAAVERGDTKIIPDIWTKTYFEWMHNIKDWCVSRQIWWGHRIPAWTCEQCGELIVAVDTPNTCPACPDSALVQETDVLDTWFSSALWPFSTMGWPEETDTLKTFYPTSVLVTGFDILFFWVARMMMMGLHFMKDVPFKDVYIHALVRDAEGKKMSKSKGNVIDPLYVIDKFGTDAFRFTLSAFAAQGRDIKLSEDRIEGYRHFINKLWNASRFSLMHLEAFEPKALEALETDTPYQTVADQWIVSRLDTVVETVTTALNTYKFNEGAGALYQFVWHEFCDWYLEIIKSVLYDDGSEKEDEKGTKPSLSARRDTTLTVLWTVLNETLRLLHPFVPFVTEEIWEKLPGTQGSIMKAEFPVCHEARRNDAAERSMELIMGVISGIRNVRGEMNVPPGLRVEATVQSPDNEVCQVIHDHRDMIIDLAKLSALSVTPPGERPTACATSVFGESTIFVSLEGIIDFRAEKERLTKEIGKIEKELLGIEKKLGNESFLTKAPKEVVDGVRQKREQFVEKKTKLKKHLTVVHDLI
jgi:valyl-tRNA synthetase